jgi:hypothetical protein
MNDRSYGLSLAIFLPGIGSASAVRHSGEFHERGTAGADQIGRVAADSDER